MSQIHIPKNWKLVTVGALSEIITKGSTPTTYGHNYTEDGIPFLRAENVANNRLDFNNLKYISKETHNFLKRSIIKPNDVLLTIAGTIGRTAVVPKESNEMNSNQAVAIIRLNHDCLPEYLSYFLNSNLAKQQITGSQVTTSISNLSLGMIEKLSLPLPPKDIQKKIVQKLDYVLGQLEEKRKVILERKETMMNLISKHPKSFKNRVRNNQGLLLQVRNFLLDQAYSGRLTSDFRNKRIEKSDVLDFYDKIRYMKRKLDKIQSKDSIQHTKTNMQYDKFPIPSEWAWGNINEIEIFVGSGSTPKGGKSVYVQNGIPFIRSQNVYSDKLHLDDIAFIPKEIHEQMSRSQLKPGDVLLNITGASIGRSTVVPTSLKEGNVNQHVCIIRTPNLINPEYLSRWLNSSFIQKMILEKQKGETREGLNYTHIRSLPIPITTLEEQNEIIRIIKEKNNHVQFIGKRLSDVLLLQEKILRHIDQTSNSILNMAFSGKLLN